MTEISIDLAPDPEQDAQAQRAALGLLTASLYDADEPGVKELAGAALHELLESVVGDLSEVREESKPALQHMLSVVARQHSAFTAVAFALAAEAYTAGQAEPGADEPDWLELLQRVREGGSPGPQ